MEVRRLPAFDAWLRTLKDRAAVVRIAARLSRLEGGKFGDHRSVGDGLGELRIDHGPGYRVYFVRRGELLVVLLCGGDKSSQKRDIDRAKALAAGLER